MTTAELHFQLRFCKDCITLAVDRADAAYGRGAPDEGDAWSTRAEGLCVQHTYIHALWRESQANGRGRVEMM